MILWYTVYLGITELELGWLPSRGSGSPFAWQYMARGPRVMWRADRPWFIACLRFTCSNMGYTYSIPTWTVVFIFNLRNPQQWLDGHLFFWDISTMTNMVAIWVKSCLNLVRRTDLASRRTVNHPMFGCQLGLTTDSEGILQTGTVPKIGGSSRTNDLQLLFFFWMDTQVFELYHFQKRGMNHGSFNFPPVPLAAQVGGQGGSQGIGHSHQPPITRIFGKSPI